MDFNTKLKLLGIVSPIFFIGLLLLLLQHDLGNRFQKKPSPEAFKTACNSRLKQTLNDIQEEARNLASLSVECYKKKDATCKSANSSSSAFIETLDSKDLSLRWGHFSCSPILFTKLRLMHKRAEMIQAHSSLSIKTAALESEAKGVLDLVKYISLEMDNIQKDCCSK